MWRKEGGGRREEGGGRREERGGRREEGGGRREEGGERREEGVHVCDGSANNDLYVNNAHRLFDEVVPEAFVINLMGGL